jgi:hypothetical protein
MKSKSGKDSTLVSAAAMYGRFTTTIGVVVAVIFALIWVGVGIASISSGAADSGALMIAVGVLIGVLAVVYYKAVMKSRRVAAVVGAWNFFGAGNHYPRAGVNLVPLPLF